MDLGGKIKKYLVTGGNGFIGAHLVRHLLADGKEVHILARQGTSFWRLQDVVSQVKVWYGDLTNYPTVNDCVLGAAPDVIIHLGGGSLGRPWNTDFNDLESSIEVNLHGTLNLLKAVTENHLSLHRFIRTGGLLEYGHGPVPFNESQREQPASIYPATQVATTTIVNAMRSSFDFPLLTLRLASVYGPGRSLDFFVPSIIKHCLQGIPFEMTSGEQVWDMVYVEDVIAAFKQAVECDVNSGEVINIGSGEGFQIKELAAIIVELIGGEAKLKLGALPDTDGAIPHLVCDIDKAHELLAWEPRTPLEVGLAKTIEWYRDNMEHIPEKVLS